MNRRTFLGTSLMAPALLSRCAPRSGPPVVVPEPLSLASCRADYRFENWAETISCRPSSYCQPTSIDQLTDVVKAAGRAGKKVKTVGAGHSWAPLMTTNDVLVNLDRMQQILTIDKERKTATVQAGIRLKNLLPALTQQGLAMHNLGSITEQSIAGATATGTHGTGIGLQNLSAAIVGAKVVTGAGDVVDITDEERLRAVRVSVGALGIVSEVTLRLVDHYDLESTAYWAAFDDVVGSMDEMVARNTRLRLWWIVWGLGNREQMIVTTLNPPDQPSWVPGSGTSAGNIGKASLPAQSRDLLKARPKAGGGFLKFNQMRGSYTDALFVPLLKVVHKECEFAVPAQNGAEALRACKRFFDEGDVSLKMPVEVRWVAKDQSLMSPARGGDVCYIGISTETNALEVFSWFEPMMKRLGGRPHWGKFYSLNRDETRRIYPDSFDAFIDLKKAWDPRGVFANELVQQIFG